jgi:hypothetical protein
MKTSSLACIYSIRHARNWRDLMRLQEAFARQGQKWIFRGQSSDKWGLATSLERTVRRFNRAGISISTIEGGLLRQFQRRAHHYLPEIPPKAAWLEWLALMQHHGAPTRLMDWTYSFYVALFFALEEANGRCAIWALDLDWVDRRLEERLPADAWRQISTHDRNLENHKTFQQVFARPAGDRIPLVCAVNPFRLNQRLSIQQGVFLCAGDISKTFEQNLSAMFPAGQAKRSLLKCVITLDRRAMQDVIQRLICMNMTRTSLFPGLDGFARSQALALAFPDMLVPDIQFPDR